MEVRPVPVARWWIVRALTALAGATWIGAARAPWYTSTRVDLEPERVTGIGLALVPHLLVLAPFVVAAVASVRRTRLAWWAPVTVLVAALPGVLLGLAVPALSEAATTDTEVVGEPGPWILGVAVLLAVAAVTAASRPRPFRTPAAGWSG